MLLPGRYLALPFVAAATVAVSVIGVTSASADADPVTGGTATLDVSLCAATTLARANVFILPTKPASVSYDAANAAVAYDLPVTGGDASTNTLYGSLKLGGDLLVTDIKTRRHVTLSNLTFDIAADTISATTSTGSAPVVVFDALGNHDYSTVNPETFSASSVQVDAAGAKVLNTMLHDHAFKTGAVLGSFSTTFTNSTDG